MYQKYVSFLDQDFNDDYWSDIALGQAAEILVQFTQRDWDSLKHYTPYKQTHWQRRCAETLSEVESPIAISILKQLMENSDHEVIIAAADSLNALASMGFGINSTPEFIQLLMNAKINSDITGRLVIESLENKLLQH